MINAIIIDDEQHAIENLKFELNQHCPAVNIIAESTNSKDAIKLINNLRPDLVFLDIEMPWMNGFDLLQKVTHLDFDLIFVTAYDKYAIKAFKFSAIDYLLKPVSGEDLKLSMTRVLKKKSKFNNQHLETLLQNLKHEKVNPLEKIVLPTMNGLEFIQVDDIIRCESDSNYCNLVLLNDRSIYLAKTLKEIESLLVDHNFIRVHQSHLIAEKYITKYLNTDGGYIVMINGDKLPISRIKKNQFLSRFK
jgi:two-component system LytT family response regulator